MELKVLTFATEEASLGRFRRSCSRVGIEPVVLGLGGPYPGHVYRLQQMLPVLQDMDPQQIVLFADGYDCVIVQPAETILARYAEMGSPPVLYSAEHGCYPDGANSHLWPPSTTPYRFLNAGCWIGTAGAVCALWRAAGIVEAAPERNDQGLLGEWYLQHPDAFALDYHAALFQNLFDSAGDIDYATGRNRETGTTPAVFHASGRSDMSRLYALMCHEWQGKEPPPMDAAKVMLISSIGPGKEYCRAFLCRSLAWVAGVAQTLLLCDGPVGEFPDVYGVPNLAVQGLPEWTGDTSDRCYRIAAMREWARQAFLASDCTHLLFLDADTLAPSDILGKLLRYDAAAVTALYNGRSVDHVRLPIDPPSRRPCSQTRPFLADAFGMGCMLLRRDALEVVGFRYDGVIGEDFLWCRDAAAAGFAPVVVDPSVSCWHVRETGTANRLTVEEEYPGVMWTDHPHYVSNRYGRWENGVVRYDLTPEQAATLGPGFVRDNYARLTVEVRALADTLEEIASSDLG